MYCRINKNTFEQHAHPDSIYGTMTTWLNGCEELILQQMSSPLFPSIKPTAYLALFISGQHSSDLVMNSSVDEDVRHFWL